MVFAKFAHFYYDMSMAEDSNVALLGRKVFFLYPSEVTQNHIISELSQEEFEVYIFRDYTKLKQALVKYPDSIFFASINEVMRKDAWEALIKDIMISKETSTVDIGIITSIADEDLKVKYTAQFSLRCGYTLIKTDYGSVLKQLISFLNNANAKGRRKYIRVITGKETNTTVSLPLNGTFLNGRVKDISVAGFSCVLPDDSPVLPKNGVFEDMLIRLQSQLIKAEGVVFGSGGDESPNTYVILFTQRTDPDGRTKIHKYIQSKLQNTLDQELKAIPPPESKPPENKPSESK